MVSIQNLTCSKVMQLNSPADNNIRKFMSLFYYFFQEKKQ